MELKYNEYLIRLHDKFSVVKGTKFKIDNLQFGISKTGEVDFWNKNAWVVTELTTGLKITDGRTRVGAKSNIINNKELRNKITEMLNDDKTNEGKLIQEAKQKLKEYLELNRE